MAETEARTCTAEMAPSVDPKTASGLDAIYGEGASSCVETAKVLVVGAGGVGCEVVKNLAFAGFRHVTLIDLDTIDVSNLNRQFLFRRRDVSEPKAVTAANAIRAMVPQVQIEGIIADIKDPRFDVTFFKSFTLVCNALDNLDARRHVNRMCLAASVPLIDSGSTGYNGNVYVLSQDVECYDCTEQPPQKSYAVCTIRSTPEKPVHCVVWAKSLWDLIFGPEDDGNLLQDLDGAEEVPNNVRENSADSNSKKRTRRVRYSHPEAPSVFADRVCARVFVDDINEQAKMKDLWTSRAPPTPYDVSAVGKGSEIDLAKLNLLEQRVWEKEECAAVLRAVLVNVADNRQQEIGNLAFEKDDPDALAFVVAAANLRAQAYGVQLSTPFQVKGIAGNIVHAVATTNAMVGGHVVLEALKLAANDGDVSTCLNTYVTPKPSGSRVKVLICPEKLRKPKPNCFVCSKGQLVLTLDTEATTLRMLVDNVLVKKISALEPSVNVSTGNFHNTLYECGEGLEEDEIEDYAKNMAKSLAELHVGTGSQLQIEDLKQALKCVVHVIHEKGCESDKPPSAQFILKGAAPLVDASNGTSASKTGVHESKALSSSNEPEDVDEVECVSLSPDEPVKESVVAPTKYEIFSNDENSKKNGIVTEDKTAEPVAFAAVDTTSVTPDEDSTENAKEEESTADVKPKCKTQAKQLRNAEPIVNAGVTELVNMVKNASEAEETDAAGNAVLKKRKLELSGHKGKSAKRAREDQNPAMA